MFPVTYIIVESDKMGRANSTKKPDGCLRPCIHKRSKILKLMHCKFFSVLMIHILLRAGPVLRRGQ